MARMSNKTISQKLAALLAELSAGGVHCVVLIGTVTGDNPTFGLEYNTKREVAVTLLRAGLDKLHRVGSQN